MPSHADHARNSYGPPRRDRHPVISKLERVFSWATPTSAVRLDRPRRQLQIRRRFLKRLLEGIDARTVGKAIRNPSRAIMRLVLRARLARTGIEGERERLLGFLSQHYGVDGTTLAAEYRHSEFLTQFRERREALERFAGPIRLGTTGKFGCEALYLVVRAARPHVVVETGVLYGASSAHILAALARNGGGELHSLEWVGTFASHRTTTSSRPN